MGLPGTDRVMSLMYRMYGAGAAMVFVACGTAYKAMDRAANWKSAMAEVSYIDRTCKIVTTTYDGDYKPTDRQTATENCNSIDEWAKAKRKHDTTVVGKAVVHLAYTAPQNGQPEVAELNLEPKDAEFYDLKAGDRIEILVSNKNPSEVRKA